MAETVLRLTPEQIRETSLVDLALEWLRATNKPHYYRDLMNELARLRGLSEEEVNDVIARLYTEINMDGRFLCIGNNVWGLKRWYPTDKTAEKSVGGKKFLRKDIDWEDEEDEDVFEEEEDEVEVEEEEDLFLFGRNKDEDEEEDVEDLGNEDEEAEVLIDEEGELPEVLEDEDVEDSDEELDIDEDEEL